MRGNVKWTDAVFTAGTLLSEVSKRSSAVYSQAKPLHRHEARHVNTRRIELGAC